MVSLRSFALVILALAITGCGRSDLPELGRVEGTVTLDGKPIPNAAIGFYPLSGGRQALAIFDQDGHYDLTFVDGYSGAKTGLNEVTVFWPDGSTPTAKIPAKYNSKTELQFDVKPGKNTYDIALESK
ncbi:MAG: carboxypeptidase regulatory-like domain-containing protein [Pirellulaceae bacterium]